MCPSSGIRVHITNYVHSRPKPIVLATARYIAGIKLILRITGYKFGENVIMLELWDVYNHNERIIGKLGTKLNVMKYNYMSKILS